jgi:signal transduction histidine kinase
VPEPLDPAVLGELLGLLAHDLRNPLSALHSNLGYLTSVIQEQDTDAREAISDGLVSCDGLAHIIDNIDLLGQSMREGARPDVSLLDVGALVSDVVASCRPMAESHGVSIQWAGSPKERVTAQGPRELATRALANLVRNSIQHSPSGAAVHVSISVSSGSVSVLVEDAGASMVGPVRTAAFTPAGQGGAKAVPNGRYSRGLGLFAAALAATAAGATARVIDPPRNSGNAFELVLARG